MIERLIRSLARRAMALSVLSVLTGCASLYSSRQGTASVVEAETGQPIAEVVIAATWTLDGGQPSNLIPSDLLYVTDTVTDGTGHFSLPPVGPIQLPPTAIAPPRRALAHTEPHIYLYKPGYRYTIVVGSTPASGGGFKGFRSMHALPPTIPWWHDRVFRLQRFTGRPAEDLERLEMLPLRNCGWADMPHMAAAYVNETRRVQNSSERRSREISEELLHESCPNAPHPLANYLR